MRKSCFSFLDDGLFFWFHLCDAKFKWFSVKFSHNFHKELRGDTVGPKTKFAHFFSRGALMLLTLLFRDYFTLLSRNYDFCTNYSLGLNFTTFPENTLIQFSFFSQPRIWPSKWVLAVSEETVFSSLSQHPLAMKNHFHPPRIHPRTSPKVNVLHKTTKIQNFPPLKKPNLAQENFHPKNTHTHTLTLTQWKTLE